MTFSNKTILLKIICSIAILFSYSLSVNSQSIDNEMDYLNWFDQLIGIENTQLSYGIVYREKYNVINEKHKFFLSSNFLKGYVMYDGESYYGVEMKYDIFEDEILLKLNGILLLDKGKIDNFTINEQKFTKISDEFSKKNGIIGFYEIPLNTPLFKILIKHKKKKVKRVGNKNIYFEFSTENQFFLFCNDAYYPIKNSKNLVKVFPEFKNEINNYSKEFGKKSDKSKFLLDLMNRIYDMKTEEFKDKKK